MIIGLCGYAQTGKDSLYLMVQDKFKRFAFADLLKGEVISMLERVGINADFGSAEEKTFWRDMLVFWGRKQRQIDPDYWVDKVLCASDFEQVFHDNDVIITDVRYQNEVNKIMELGGQVIRIRRPDFEANNEEELTTISIIDRKHPELPVLVNDGSMEKLRDNFLGMVEVLRNDNSR